ncbi:MULTISPECIES: hypothetical protein [Streptococcus]|uniref:Uncharacterized protein n=1 Tax=Streptococcus viridans TaxID=78535 RepID=A0A3S4PZA5_9STRE|nr:MULTISPECIES: hypothetical protein [Streptococcus]VED66840.1 Uncharacterised protein [Streptococcus viridans]VEE18304.1 Uncharacterised protein [Streptococcus australis]
MNKTLSNQKRKLTTIKNQVLKARDFHLEAENLSNTEAILTALKSDKKSVQVNYEENGEIRSYLYDHVDMIDSISPYPLVSNFIESKIPENYQLLLNGCFCSVMADMASAKYLAKGGSNFDTDICLNILFALAYLDDTYVEFLIDKLVYFKEAQVEKGKQPIFFSSSSLLPLVVFLYGNGEGDRLASLLENACDAKYKPLDSNPYHNVNDTYKQVMETIFSEDMDVFRETILSMCDYHLANTKDSHLVEFNTLLWQYSPIEIIVLLKERQKRGLSIDGISHPLLDDFLPYFMDDFQISEQNKMILGTILE